MDQAQWNAVDKYFEGVLCLSDACLDAALARSEAAGLPAHNVAPNQGKLLQIFARMTGASRILEIGTMGGYSAIWLARALPAGGRLITLESNPAHAHVARENIRMAGLEACVEIIVGDARDTLQRLLDRGTELFDMIFIDADKADNPRYLSAALELARDGAVIVGDNVVRGGRLMAPEASDAPDVRGMQGFFELMARDLRVSATAIQTVGGKGWDGFAVGIVNR